MEHPRGPTNRLELGGHVPLLLSGELDKRTEPLDCAHLLELPIEWAERQFRLIGRRDARDLAIGLIASYQGIALLTNTFRDPELMAREARRLERWIDSLA